MATVCKANCDRKRGKTKKKYRKRQIQKEGETGKVATQKDQEKRENKTENIVRKTYRERDQRQRERGLFQEFCDLTNQIQAFPKFSLLFKKKFYPM